jgi:hypothetical protein
MASEMEKKQQKEIELSISRLMQEAVDTYGEKLAMSGLVAASAQFVGQLDRVRKGMNVLAAWMRAFTLIYDSAYYSEGPDLSSREPPFGMA